MDYIGNGKCAELKCGDRHPEICRLWISSKCKRNESCYFLHGTFENSDETNATFKCVGLKNVWADRTCVVKHNIQGHETFFCLNCEDWVKFKTMVHEQNGTLYDKSGNLRRDI